MNKKDVSFCIDCISRLKQNQVLFKKMAKLRKEIKVANFDLHDRLVNNNNNKHDHGQSYKSLELFLKNATTHETKGKLVCLYRR